MLLMPPVNLNRPHDAVPMHRQAGLVVPIRFDGHNFDVVEQSLKDVYAGFKAWRLVSVRFHQQPPEIALRSRVGSLLVSAESKEFAELPDVGPPGVVLRFQFELGNPFFPLARPGKIRRRAAGNIVAGVKQGVRLTQADGGLVAHSAPPSCSGSPSSCSGSWRSQ